MNLGIVEDRKCKDCGWKIMFALCHESFKGFKDEKYYDRIYYCFNKACTHHEGEGVSQFDPEWVIQK